MKNLLAGLLAMGFTIALAACSEKKAEQPETEEAPVGQPKFTSISGVVTDIQPGKDGYTATVLTFRQERFLATISRANLTDPDTYRSVEIGDSLRVIGEEWEMENEQHLTVREILK